MIGECRARSNWRLILYFSLNKSDACGYQCLAVECFIKDKKSKSEKGHNSKQKKKKKKKKKKKMHFELSPLIA